MYYVSVYTYYVHHLHMHSTRPMPGYGGFVPRYPVYPENSHMCGGEQIDLSSMCSTTRSTYRLAGHNINLVIAAYLSHVNLLLNCRGFPKEEYRALTFGHKGSLSKTVTLTYPFNPFNKV